MQVRRQDISAITYAMRRPIMALGVKEVGRDTTVDELKGETFNVKELRAEFKYGYGL